MTGSPIALLVAFALSLVLAPWIAAGKGRDGPLWFLVTGAWCFAPLAAWFTAGFMMDGSVSPDIVAAYTYAPAGWCLVPLLLAYASPEKPQERKRLLR